MPTTKIEMGRVASTGAGASALPTMAPVAYTTTAFAPARAWAMASRQMFPRWMSSGSRAVAGSLMGRRRRVARMAVLPLQV